MTGSGAHRTEEEGRNPQISQRGLRPQPKARSHEGNGHDLQDEPDGPALALVALNLVNLVDPVQLRFRVAEATEPRRVRPARICAIVPERFFAAREDLDGQ